MRVSFLIVAMLMLGVFMSQKSESAELKAGDVAPDFSLVGSDGKTYELSSFKEDGKAVVIAWFPKAFTGG
jgi:peroxiredoxin Q/BCP